MTALRTTVGQRHSHQHYDGPRRWFNLAVHPTVEQLRAAATAYRPHSDFGKTLGCCHPAPVRAVVVDGELVEKPYVNGWAGVIRLAATHVDTEIVAHEITHAALVVYRMDVCTDVRLGVGARDREETLAYIAGDLMGAAATALHELGVWS